MTIRSGLCVFSLAMLFSTPCLSDCDSLAEAIQAAARTGDTAELAHHSARIATEPTCPDAYRAKLSRVSAYGYLRAVSQHLAAGSSLPQQEDLLRQSLSLSRTWQALAMLGDLHHQRKDYAAAARTYQEALSKINDPAATQSPPDEATIATIFQKASEARMLADRYVQTPVNHRSGSAEGLALTSVRGWTVKRVPVPVTFATGSTDFTPKGLEAARELAGLLRQKAPPSVSIIGHTDARGPAAQNQALSQRRAEALATFLRGEGYQGQIITEGVGESQPATLSDPSLYSQEEVWQLNRRVELVWPEGY